MIHPLQYGAYLAVRLTVCGLQCLRIETCAVLSGWLSLLAADVLRIRGKVIDQNLRHAYPALSARARRTLARRMWRHLFLFVAEVAHAPRKIHETNWRDYFRLRSQSDLVRALLDDRPLLVVSAHFGNFELAGYMLGILGFPTSTVARTLDNPYLDRFVNRFRGAKGQSIVPKKGGYDQIVAVLAAGGAMTFLADQYAGAKGCWVEFFGREASVHKAIALLALEHQAPMAVGFARRLGRPLHFELGIDGLADPAAAEFERCGVRELTAWYTARLERVIRRAPEQYWWLHRRWKDRRPARRRRANAA